jgi:predicted RND superfamily exporter protein
VLLAGFAGTTLVQITPDNRVFYGPNNKHFNQFLDFEANYTPNNNIIFVIDLGEPFATPRHAEAIAWLTQKVWEIDHVIRVDSIATYPEVTGTLESIEVENLLSALCPTNDFCKENAAETLDRPHLVNRLVSTDLSAAGVIATLTIDIGSLGTIELISATADDVVEGFSELFPEFDMVRTGGVPMMTAFAESSQDDLSLLLPTALVIIFSLLVTFFGGIRPALILSGISIASAICTVGIAGWLGFTINSATAIVPLVVFTVVVASSMHITIHFLRSSEGRSSPDDIRSAAKAALEGNLAPMVVSSVTSMAGLLSLTFVDSPPLQQLGQLSAVGVLLGSTAAIFVLPIFLGNLRTGYRSRASTAIQQALNRYARTLEGGRTFAIPASAVMALTLVGLTQLEVNDDFVDYFDTRTEFRQATDRATDLLSGPNHIEVLLENSDQDGVFDPQYVDYLRELVEFLRKQDRVSNVASYADVLDELSNAFLRPIDDVTDAAEFAQWNLAYELSLTRGQSNTDFIRSDQQESRVSILLDRTSSRQIQELERAIYEWHTDQQSDFDLLVTGENIPVAHVSAVNITSMIGGLGLSIIFVTAMSAYLVRRLKLGIVALFATLAPLLCGFGVWALLGNSIGLASTAIIALTVGVVIDDAVHMLYRFVDGKDRLSLDSWSATAYSVHRAGTAIATTSIVMMTGLAVLLTSSFAINSSFGAVTCLIIALALLFDLLVLPRLLVWADPNR